MKDIKDLPIADLADTLRSKFMEPYARRRIGEKFKRHVMLAIVVRQLYAMSQQLSHLKQRRGRCVCLFLTNSYLLHIFNLSQLYIYRKSRAKKGKAGWPDGCTKGDVAPSPSKRQKVNVEENLVNNSPRPVASTMASEMNTSPGPITRR